MILLQASHIEKSFGAEKVLDDVTLIIQDNERIGLVGKNGAGKSTLLKIINGDTEPGAGQIFKAKGMTTGYLAQDGGIESRRTIWEELLASFQPLVQQEKELRTLEASMSDPLIIEDKKTFRQISSKYAALSDQFRRAGGYTYHAAARSILQGLQFVDDEHNTLVSALSGGQKTRLALAKLLINKPDVLILDEPTNYLDMDTISWLEKYLQSYPGAILIVSHDRYFLDNLVNVVFELEDHKITRYNSNYSGFIKLKAARRKKQLAEYNKFQSEKTRLEEFIQKNISRDATSGRAKARQKQLQKMQPVAEPPGDSARAGISFGINRQSGKEILTVKNLAIGYHGKPVARDMDFQITRGQRVALLGPNGTGKTTLLKTIVGRLFPISGEIIEGFHVTIGYHDQEQKSLSLNKTVLDELWDDYPGMDEKDVRGILGRFLFTGDDVFKEISTLSGGEKARLVLAKLMCRQANFLILDEPTNHLDIYSREALEESLLDYPGTLLFVSHDRYFLNKIATKVIELHQRGTTEYEGHYDYYLTKKAPLNSKTETDTGPQRQGKQPGKGKEHYLRTKEKERKDRKRRRRIQELEKQIHKTENMIKSLEKELCLPGVYSDHLIYQEKDNHLKQMRSKLESYLEEWMCLQET